MSATLPKISKLFLDGKELSKDNFIYLIKNKQEYFLNPNFKDRVKFDFTYLEKDLSIEQIPEIVYKHSEEYYANHKNVKSIIEFVTKLSAHTFYEIIINKKLFCDYEKYIITGTILEPRRKEIINYLKSTESDNKKILVICTQVIETGLDIDMDIGFRDKGIVDSEEQFAGRINRNASKNEAELFVFNIKDAKKVFKSDLRYKQNIDTETYKMVLSEKDYDLLYNKVFTTIKKDNENPYLAENLNDFISQIKSLHFREVKEQFQLIKDNTLSVFVPCEIDKQHFTSGEINFLFIFEPEICKQDTIDGEVVWNIYDMIITNKEKIFDKKIDLKIISSILSKFTFNIWKNNNTINLLRHYAEDEFKYGFIKLLKHKYGTIYSYKTGLKTDLETDCNFL
jgi:CRISPR-associated endonuclease/helicase Cas3